VQWQSEKGSGEVESYIKINLSLKGEVENIFKNREGTKQIRNARGLKIGEFHTMTQQHSFTNETTNMYSPKRVSTNL
jgi:hypothetical protein